MADVNTLKKKKPGQTQEEVETGLTGGPGLYRHPNGQEVHVLYDPLYGNAQAEAAIRVGFEFVRESDPSEIKTIVTGTDAEKGAATVDAVLGGTTSEDIKGLQARLTAVEKDKDAEIESLKAQLAAKNGTEQSDTEAEAKAQTEARNDGAPAAGAAPTSTGVVGGVTDLGAGAPEAGEGETDGEGSDEGDDEGEGDDTSEVTEKPLGSQNSTELKETATREGVEITPELDTNKKLAAAIQAARDAKKGE